MGEFGNRPGKKCRQYPLAIGQGCERRVDLGGSPRSDFQQVLEHALGFLWVFSREGTGEGQRRAKIPGLDLEERPKRRLGTRQILGRCVDATGQFEIARFAWMGGQCFLDMLTG